MSITNDSPIISFLKSTTEPEIISSEDLSIIAFPNIISSLFDFESKQMYSIRVKSTSSNGYYLEKKFTILINDVPDSIKEMMHEWLGDRFTDIKNERDSF